MAASLTTSILGTYMHRNISDICPYHYTLDNFNHCAHFVGHVLGLKIGETCAMQTVEKVLRDTHNAQGVSIRVHEIFHSVGFGVRIDVAAATGSSLATSPTLATSSSGGAAVATSSGAATISTSGDAAVVTAAATGVPPAECLIYATAGDVVGCGIMPNVPNKHIGIYFAGLVWHYSNSKERVVSQSLSDFAMHYKSSTVLYYTGFPREAMAVERATAFKSALPVGSYHIGIDKKNKLLINENPKYKPTPTPTATPFATPTRAPTASPFATPGVKR
jgi:hypothetical protein